MSQNIKHSYTSTTLGTKTGSQAIPDLHRGSYAITRVNTGFSPLH